MKLTKTEQITRLYTDESAHYYVVETSAKRMIDKLSRLGYQGKIVTAEMGLPTPYLTFYIKRNHVKFLSAFDKRFNKEDLSQKRRENMLQLYAEGKLSKVRQKKSTTQALITN